MYESRIGLSAVLSVVITAIILIFLGIFLMFIVNSSLFSFLSPLSEENAKSFCLNKKEAYCNSNPGEEWHSASTEFQGRKCSSVLPKDVYYCESCEKLCKGLENAGKGVSKEILTKKIEICERGCVDVCPKNSKNPYGVKKKYCDGDYQSLLQSYGSLEE